MLANFKNVLFPGHNHLLTTDTDTWHFDYRPMTRHFIAWAPARVIIKVKGHRYQWLAVGYDLKIGHF